MERSPDPFAQLADEAAVADAARRRTQTRWLRQQASEEATLAGTLADLAESGVMVQLRSQSGRTYRGPVSSLGGDFVVIGRDAWIRLDAVVAVRPDPGRSPGAASGEPRPTSRDRRLADVLADLAAERAQVVIAAGAATAAEAMRGELEAVGLDVVTLVLDGDRRTRCYVAVAAIADVIVVG